MSTAAWFGGRVTPGGPWVVFTWLGSRWSPPPSPTGFWMALGATAVLLGLLAFLWAVA